METLSINTDYGLKRTVRFKTVIHPLSEDGHEQRIGKSVSGRHVFRLVFKERLVSELKTGLYEFYKARLGSLEAFNLVDPTTDPPVTRKVRFEQDELEEEFFYKLLENSQITVIEVP